MTSLNRLIRFDQTLSSEWRPFIWHKIPARTTRGTIITRIRVDTSSTSLIAIALLSWTLEIHLRISIHQIAGLIVMRLILIVQGTFKRITMTPSIESSITV